MLKNLIVVGANSMDYIITKAQLNNIVYKNGLFIEALPDVCVKLEKNVNIFNEKYNTNYKCINALVTDKENEKYPFYIFSNNGESSSIFKPNDKNWLWKDVNVSQITELSSVTMKHIIEKNNWNNKKFDVILDVQGSELKVLKGFKSYINNMDYLTVEISKKEFYVGGVLFEELNNFLLEQGFTYIKKLYGHDDHCDVLYKKN